MAMNGTSRNMTGEKSSNHYDKVEKKPFIITRMLNKITSSMENGFYMLGMLIGNHPLKSVLLSGFVVGIFALGVLNFTEDTDSDTLWVPSDAEVFQDKTWVSANFPSTLRTVSVIFVSSNVLSTSAVQAMNTLYKSSLGLTTSSGKNYTDVCFKSGSNCLVNSVLELWSYNDANIVAASATDILNTINTATVSPLYGRPFDVTTVLGSISYSSGTTVSAAEAAKITFFLNGDSTNKDESMAWETKMVDLVQNTQNSAISDYYVLATRSFSDVASDAIGGDISLLSAGYMIVIIYIIIILGRFNCLDFGLGIAVCGILVIGLSLGFSYGLASAAGWKYTPLHSILPFLLLGIGVDDLFVIMGAYKSLPIGYLDRPIHERMAMTLKHAGVSITVTSLTDMCAFGIGATTVLPALRSFCVFCCLGILALFLMAATFFVGCIALTAKRRDADRNSLVCCYRHNADYRPNECSKTELFVAAIKKFYAPTLMRLPVKIAAMVVTAIFLGFGIWGFVVLKQDYNPIWFIPSDSYPYKYDGASNKYFNTGAQASAYCKNIDYFSSKTQFDSLYTQLTGSSYISTGSTDSWFKSFTDWLSTTSTASVTSRLDGSKYPTTSTNFYDLLYEFVTTEATGLRHRSEVVFTNNSGVLGVSASYIKFTHIVLTDSTSKINAMENTMSIVSDLFSDDNCFAYGRLYLQWYTNKVIQTELYRNLGLAALCVFVVCLILIANLFTSLMVLSCVIFTLLDVGGMMNFWGLTIDTVTSIILILAIGLAVDYSAHIGHCFMTFTGDRNARVRATLVEMGSPVFSGAFSTFLAFILLAFSNSYVFTTFFKVFLLVAVFGVFHGLVYLPVLLSWIGPLPYMTAERGESGAGEVELRITSADLNHKSRSSLQGETNLAMENKHDLQFSKPPVKSHVNGRGKDRGVEPPPDYNPEVVQRPTNMPVTAIPMNYHRHDHISDIPPMHPYRGRERFLNRQWQYRPQDETSLKVSTTNYELICNNGKQKMIQFL
ncbi:Niemann-Pick C1 protein [Mizuhopecten yessoensis]|uniref:Niemann-Pick C1 protein n=1 Tax=Mizuhopecten yessoensis TaxID=6573 RepID=A0A210Q487_MIZYE|nr:Niemann-Pick C1 protein [Mizuhopecten yessoensis]